MLSRYYPWISYPQLELNRRRHPRAMASWQDLRLKALVKHAFERVPFYRQRLESAGLSPPDLRGVADLRRLPLLEPEDLKGANSHRLLARGWKRENLIHHQTSGSSGRPAVVYRSWHEERMLGLLRFRAYFSWGFRWHHKRAVIRVPTDFNWTPNRPLEMLNRMGILRLRAFNCFLQPDALLPGLEAYQPDLITGYAGVLASLARHIESRGGSRLSPRWVSPGGEVLTPIDRELLERVFPSARVLETYGATEFNLMAWECPETGLLHTCDDGLIVEVLNPAGQPVQPGEAGDLVGTALHSFAMPILRFPLGDLVVKGLSPCPCGLPFSTLEKVQGRQLGSFLLSNGRILHPFELLNELLRQDTSWIRQYQLVQEKADQIILYLVPRDEAPVEQLRRLEEALQRVLGAGVDFHVHRRAEIPREANGKFTLVRLPGRRS